MDEPGASDLLNRGSCARIGGRSFWITVQGNRSMTELFIGAGAATGLVLLLRFVKTHALSVTWWQWGLTILGILYGVFVLEVVVSFLREGTPKGAAVMGTLLGFFAVVWAVILGRTVFSRHSGRGESQAPKAEGGLYA